MAGKRPDQYQIDPGEAGATDYKNLPQTGRGHSNLDDTVELDKQRLAQGRAEASGHPASGGSRAPSADANRGVRTAAEGGDEDGSEPKESR